MPFETLLESVKQAIAIQSSISAGPSLTETNYHEFLSNPLPPQLPGNETVTDENMVGDGISRTLRNIYNYYWTEKTLQIGGTLNDHIAAILMKGFLGGTHTITPGAPVTVLDYLTLQKVSNVTPNYFSVYRKLGGEQFILADLFPNSFNISQDGEGMPNFSFDLLGTGKFLDDTALVAGGFTTEADFVDAPNYEYFHGAATVFTATDGVTTYDFTNQGKLISLSVEGGNGGRTARRPGDVFQTPADRNSGAFSRNAAMGKASGLVRVKIDLGSALTEFKAMVQRKTLTSGSIKFVGMNKVLATANDYEFQINFPRSRFRMIDGDTDQDYGALSIEIQPERDLVTGGYFTARIRTDKTLI